MTQDVTQPLDPDVVQQVAQSIAQEIIQRQGSAPNRIQTLGAVDGTAGDLTGGFTLAIIYKAVTYSLVVTIPTGGTGVYAFTLTSKTGTADPVTIASFSYKDTSNWNVKAGLPMPITIGPVTLQTLALDLGEGSVS